MWRTMRRLSLLRLITHRHPGLFNALRLATVFSAAFGGAYGFMSGSRAPQSGYDPHAFSIGVSFLFALSCMALAALSLRNRMLKRALKKLTLQIDILQERNRELREAFDRTGNRLDAQRDLIVLPDESSLAIEANDAFVRFVGDASNDIDRPKRLNVLEQGAVAV